VARARLIEQYLAGLSARLPEALVAELADGIDQTYLYYRARGQDTDDAARSATVEFGDPDVITTAFLTLSPGRRAARNLLRSGPLVGGCWALVLLTGRAWNWPVPTVERALVSASVLAIVAMLVAASIVRRYLLIQRLAFAGGVGVVILDLTMLAYVATVAPASGWTVLLAAAASTGRVVFAATAMPAMVRV
jgi:hypothetical protein